MKQCPANADCRLNPQAVGQASATFTYTPANWSTAQTAAVTGVRDFYPDGNQTYSILTSASSADSAYNAISVANVAVTSVDSEPFWPGELLFRR